MRARRSDVNVQVVAYVALLAIAFVLSILIMGLYLRVCRAKRTPVRGARSSAETLPPGDTSASCPTAVSAAAEALGCRERQPRQGATEESTVPTETTRLTPLSQSPMREEV